MRRWVWGCALLALGASDLALAQAKKKPPYYASISAGRARMRTGPGRTYPASWLYVRADLPIKVVEVYPNWRKIEDPDGTQGWMLVHLLSDTRTALVTGDAPRPMRDAPNDGAAIVYRAEPGVVGRLSRCEGEWCLLDVGGRKGFIRKAHFWGADARDSF